MRFCVFATWLSCQLIALYHGVDVQRPSNPFDAHLKHSIHHDLHCEGIQFSVAHIAVRGDSGTFQIRHTRVMSSTRSPS
jgi:hypothetical protein